MAVYAVALRQHDLADVAFWPFCNDLAADSYPVKASASCPKAAICCNPAMMSPIDPQATFPSR